MSEKKHIFDKEMTRRHFLQLTGKGMAGLALTPSLLSVLGVTKAEVESGAVSVIPTADAVLVANGARCTGCQRCEVNCTLKNDGKAMPLISRVKVLRNYYHGNDGETGGIFGDFSFTPDTCHQCEDPACLNACPMKAISVRESDHVRVIDQEKCVGCGACVAACPFHMPTIDPEINKSTKCVACGYCAENCPMGALKVVKWEDIDAAWN